MSVTHIITQDDQSVGTCTQRGQEGVTESNKGEIFLAADCAFGRMLRAHLSRWRVLPEGIMG